MRIADLDSMEARVNVNENDVVDVKIGDSARISVDAYPDREIRGVVREIASTGHDAQRRHAGRSHELRSEDQHLRPLRAAASRHEHDRRHRDRHRENVIAVPIQSVTVRTPGSNLSPEEQEKRRVKEARAKRRRQPRRRHERDGGESRKNAPSGELCSASSSSRTARP